MLDDWESNVIQPFQSPEDIIITLFFILRQGFEKLLYMYMAWKQTLLTVVKYTYVQYITFPLLNCHMRPLTIN